MATDGEAAALNENLVRALKILEAEQRHNGVLASPDDRFTSLLKSQLAENALLGNRINEIVHMPDGSRAYEREIV